MIVLSRSMKSSKMIILLLSTAVSLTIQAAVPNPRDFNFLIDSPTLTTEDTSSNNPLNQTNSLPESLKLDLKEIATTLLPEVTSTSSSVEQDDISTGTTKQDAISTGTTVQDAISTGTTISTLIETDPDSTIVPSVMLDQDENISKEDSSITSFMLSNNFINQQIRESIEATTTNKIFENQNTSIEEIVEDHNTSTEEGVDDILTTTEREVNDLLTTIHTAIETTTLEDNSETTTELDNEITTENTSDEIATTITSNEETINAKDNYDDTTSTTVKDIEPITTSVNIVEGDTTINNDEIDTTTSKNEKISDTTLDISLAFKEIKPREELIAFNNHATEKNEELTTTEMNEDAAALDEDTDALHEELINIFTESPAFDSSFYDSFEDEDYTLTTSKNEEESHETTSLADDSFDKIVFTEDGIEPLDDSAFVLTNTHLMAALNDDAVIFTTDKLPALFGDEIYDDSKDYFFTKDIEDDVSIKVPNININGIGEEDKVVDGFIISSKSQEQDLPGSETDDIEYNDYETDESLIQKALEEYDFSFTNNEDITTVSPSDNEVDSVAIIDVLKNFIAEQDPILELFLSVCFVHPDCFQLDSPFPDTELGAQGREVLHLLKARRSETARVLLLSKIEQVVVKVKQEMFKAMEVEVAKRGVSISATKNIIDSIKNAWEDIRDDLQYAISSLHEIFSSDSLLGNPDMYTGIAQIADTLTRIPDHVKLLYADAAQNGYSRYQQFSAWNSWKREPKELKE